MWIATQKNDAPVSLKTLFPNANFIGCDDISVVRATEHNAHCEPETLFAVLGKNNTQHHLTEAIRNGASALLCSESKDITTPQCCVPNTREAYGKLCQALAGYPGTKLKTVGITGTNGKTTTAYLIRSILKAAELSAGLMGTIEYDDTKTTQSAELTTPNAATFATWLRRMTEHAATHAVFEISSHAIDQHRTAGVELDAAIVTNITQDHLDYHHSFEHYLETKAKIAQQLRNTGKLFLNRDQTATWAIRSLCPNQEIISFGFHSDADYQILGIQTSNVGTVFSIKTPAETIRFETKLIGRFNLENCAAAIAVCDQLGIAVDSLVAGIGKQTTIPGRLEAITVGKNIRAYVDFAHTDDALKRCLQTLRELTTNRLICVFGAGGDRDRTKRAKLAQAATLADFAIVTSDNPRTENPSSIIQDVIAGFLGTTTRYKAVEDRREAIRFAAGLAAPGDTILVAGKGHEQYQIIGNNSHPFDDRQELLNAFQTPLRAIPA